MIYKPEPHKVKLELMSDEIELIIDELGGTPHNIYEFWNMGKLIEKLKDAQVSLGETNSQTSQEGSKSSDVLDSNSIQNSSSNPDTSIEEDSQRRGKTA